MTVSTTSNTAVFLGNGVTNTFDFTFNNSVPVNSNFPTASYVVTYTDASGTQTTLSPSTYTLNLTQPVTGSLWGIGGTITYPLVGSPIANNTSLSIERVFGITQLTSISDQGNFNPEVIEAALDTLCMELQEVANVQSRAIQIPTSDPSNINTTLPAAAARAGQFAAFDDDGNVIAAMPGGSSGVPISAAMQPVVEAGTTAAALALLGGVSAPVANSNLAVMAANTVKVNATSSSATPTDLALSPNTLLGRGSSGNISPITLGSGLSFTGDELDVAASSAIGPGGATAFGTPGGATFTTPAGSTTNTLYRITITAGGGAGGGNGAGSGGGAGSTVIWWIQGLTAGTVFNITIGAGGAGTTGSGNNGANTVVSIGSQSVTAFAGQGALGGANQDGGIGGGGGTFSGATLDYIAVPGGGGASAYAQSNAAGSGIGGASYWGGGASSIGANTPANGNNATSYGAGGSGGYGTSVSGGNGANGFVLVEYGTPGSSGGSGGGGAPVPLSGAANPNSASVSGVTGQFYTDTSDGDSLWQYLGGTWNWVGLSPTWTINNKPGWEPANATYMTLSSNNTIATVVGGSGFDYGGISATPAKAGGKRYFEMTLSITTYSQAGIGTFVTQNNQGGSWGQLGDARQLAWNPSGNVMLPNSVVIGTAQNWSGGSTLCFAVDFPNKLIWLRVGSGNWNNSGTANPTTATGGFSWLNMGAGPVFIGTNLTGSPGANATINLGTSSFAQTVPSGFTSWIA